MRRFALSAAAAVALASSQAAAQSGAFIGSSQLYTGSSCFSGTIITGVGPARTATFGPIGCVRIDAQFGLLGLPTAFGGIAGVGARYGVRYRFSFYDNITPWIEPSYQQAEKLQLQIPTEGGPAEATWLGYYEFAPIVDGAVQFVENYSDELIDPARALYRLPPGFNLADPTAGFLLQSATLDYTWYFVPPGYPDRQNYQGLRGGVVTPLTFVGTVAAIPEPSTIVLVAGGLLTLGIAARRRRS